MRKADYQTLAELIGELRAVHGAAPAAWIADRFAARASVDRAAFLRACSLMPALPHGCPAGEYPSASGSHAKHAPHYVATGDKRPPKRGEWYLSGAIVEAYKAPNDLTSTYWIARPTD